MNVLSYYVWNNGIPGRHFKMTDFTIAQTSSSDKNFTYHKYLRIQFEKYFVQLVAPLTRYYNDYK